MPKNIIALDIGATKTAIGLVTPDNKILAYRQIMTPSKNGQKIFLNKVGELIDQLADKNTRAIAIGIAGPVANNGQKVFLNNFPKQCQRPPLKSALEKKFKLPVAIDNDVKCFTLAEAIVGAGKKYRNVLGLTIGTGIGGCLIINKKIYRGYHNWAGEFGHSVIGPLSAVRGNRQTTHWEKLAAGPALSKIYRQLTKKILTTQEITALAEQKQPPAQEALKILADYLGIGLADLLNDLAPDIVIVGGGLAQIKALWTPMRQATYQRVWLPQLKNIKIVPAKLGDRAILVGAALLARQPNRFEM